MALDSGYFESSRPIMTNADRIRAMTGKEIAKLLVDAVSIGCPFEMDWSCEKEKDGWDDCDVCWRKWLEQPAEE